MTDSNFSLNEQPIEVKGLTRKFREKTALKDVVLSVPRGRVLGLLGENGAGKTTLINHIMGLLKAKQGSVRVFGIDPVKDPVGVLSRIGYISEDRDIPHWMRKDELMNYTVALMNLSQWQLIRLISARMLPFIPVVTTTLWIERLRHR